MVKKKFVQMDMSEVEALTPDGMAVFTAQIARLPAIKISGNEPKNPELQDVFIRSGFYKYVTKTTRNLAGRTDRGLIRTQDSDVVEPETAARLVKFAENSLGMHSSRYKAAYRALIECMSNTRQHARDQILTTRHENWWATVYCRQADNRACFTFIDWGVGIVTSLKLKGMQRLLRGLSHAKILQKVLGGRIASRTGDVFRGKGLPGIKMRLLKDV